MTSCAAVAVAKFAFLWTKWPMLRRCHTRRAPQLDFLDQQQKLSPRRSLCYVVPHQSAAKPQTLLLSPQSLGRFYSTTRGKFSATISPRFCNAGASRFGQSAGRSDIDLGRLPLRPCFSISRSTL